MNRGDCYKLKLDPKSRVHLDYVDYSLYDGKVVTVDHLGTDTIHQRDDIPDFEDYVTVVHLVPGEEEAIFSVSPHELVGPNRNDLSAVFEEILRVAGQPPFGCDAWFLGFIVYPPFQQGEPAGWEADLSVPFIGCGQSGPRESPLEAALRLLDKIQAEVDAGTWRPGGYYLDHPEELAKLGGYKNG